MAGKSERAKAKIAEPIEGPWELPSGWYWARIADIADVNPRTSFDTSGECVPFVPMAAVEEESGQIDLSRVKPLSEVQNGFTRFRSGDVLFAKITPCMENGKIAVVPSLPGGIGAGSTEFHVLRPREVNSDFLFYFLLQGSFRTDAQRNMSGSAGQLRVPVDYLRQHPIPVPPPSAQRRVLRQVKRLFGELNEGEIALTEARSGLNTYRKSLLHSATLGSLSKNWRAAKNTADSGTLFLKRLDADGPGRKQLALFDDVPNHLPEIPSGWTWTTLGRIVGKIEAGLNVKCHGRTPSDSELGIVKISAVTWDRYDEEECKTPLDQGSLGSGLIKSQPEGDD